MAYCTRVERRLLDALAAHGEITTRDFELDCHNINGDYSICLLCEYDALAPGDLHPTPEAAELNQALKEWQEAQAGFANPLTGMPHFEMQPFGDNKLPAYEALVECIRQLADEAPQDTPAIRSARGLLGRIARSDSLVHPRVTDS
ncbi:MAG: hypothetical protein ACOC8P_00475 [Dichotomicrobium sp.]